MPVRIGAFCQDSDAFLAFLKQYGVEDVVGGYWMRPALAERLTHEASLAGNAAWAVEDVLAVRETCAKAGLNLFGLENPLPAICWDRIKLGQPGRDGQIASLVKTIRSMGQAGVRALGYNWMINPPAMNRYSWRTDFDLPARGGAKVEAFDMSKAADLGNLFGRAYADDEFWNSYTYFIRAIVPVCEEAGVRLALHPDDPPVPRLDGLPRLFGSVAGYERAMQIANSPASGINFCLGNWTAMGVDLIAAIRHFGGRGQIVYGHAQGVKGAVPRFEECFLDEADCDFLAVIDTLNEVGFDGPLCPGHFPATANDTAEQHQAHAYAFGYLRGLIQVVDRSAPTWKV
jgi:mannonate dehydratase